MKHTNAAVRAGLHPALKPGSVASNTALTASQGRLYEKIVVDAMRPVALCRLARTLVCFVLMGCASPCALALQPATSLDRYAKQAWSTENGLPQNSVHAMLQTADGYFWIATEGGLARFNGYQFRVFDRDTEPHLAGNDVRCLLEDSSHALWIGTSSGLTRLQDGTAHTYTTADGLPSDTVRSLLQARDGTLWILTNRGLSSLVLSNDQAATVRFQSYAQAGSPLGDDVNAMVEAADGGIWAATSKGLYRVSSSGLIRAPQVASNVSIEALTADASGSVFFASAEGIFQLRAGSIKLLAKREALPAGGVRQLLATGDAVWAAGKSGVLLIAQHGVTAFQTGRTLPGDQVETIFADRQGAVWIGTDKGVARWWKGQVESSKADASFAVLSMYEDRDGDLWVGTETAGAFEWKERVFEMTGRSQGLGEGSATSVAQTNDGALWVGTNGGGVSHMGSSTTARTYRVKDSLASDTVLALATGGTDLWIGTPDGLNHLQDGRIRTYGPADGLSDDFVRSLLVGRHGALWIGTRHGVDRMQSGRITTWTTAQGLGSNLIGAMVEDAAGDQWIGTLGGLSRIHEGSVTNYTVANGLPGDTVTALATDTAESLWVGTNGKGLAVRAGRRFFSYFGVPELPKTIFAILEDRLGYLWLSSDRGIDRVAQADLAAYRLDKQHSVVVTHYGTADGLPSSEGSGVGHPSAMRLKDGRLCFATHRGVVIVDPALLPAAHAVPPVVVEQITADDREVTRAELASLPPGPSHFSFSFAGINLASPQRLQYRYRLEGFDRDWIQAGTRRTAFYTNIPPGRYRFRVNARYGNEPWGEADGAVDLQLRPRFYQTAWFRLLLLCLLAALLLGLYRLRVQALKARFDAVAGERNRLAREIHDTLAQGFVAVSVRLEILSQILHGNRLEECREQLNETRALVHESLGEARRSIWNLRTEGADAQTLPARLARTVQSVIARGVDSQIETTGVYRPLSPVAEDELYRIAQEAVTNALRHADASEINIRLAYAQDRVRLEITDDGRGFNVSAAPSGDAGHFGLTGLHERAQAIGATLILDSKPGHGATVKVDVPISRHEKKEQRN